MYRNISFENPSIVKYVLEKKNGGFWRKVVNGNKEITKPIE